MDVASGELLCLFFLSSSFHAQAQAAVDFPHEGAAACSTSIAVVLSGKCSTMMMITLAGERRERSSSATASCATVVGLID